MNESHKMLQINMMCLENENKNEQNTFERQLQMFQMSSLAENSEEDDNDDRGHLKPHYTHSIHKTKANSNKIPTSGREKFTCYTERVNLTTGKHLVTIWASHFTSFSI